MCGILLRVNTDNLLNLKHPLLFETKMKIIGWKRWGHGKYHAIIEDHPKNTVKTVGLFRPKLERIAWTACDKYGAYLSDGGLVDNPRDEEKCKNCVKKLHIVEAKE